MKDIAILKLRPTFIGQKRNLNIPPTSSNLFRRGLGLNSTNITSKTRVNRPKLGVNRESQSIWLIIPLKVLSIIKFNVHRERRGLNTSLFYIYGTHTHL